MRVMKSLPMVRAGAFSHLQVRDACHLFGIPAAVEVRVGTARDTVLRKTLDGRMASPLGLVIVEPD